MLTVLPVKIVQTRFLFILAAESTPKLLAVLNQYGEGLTSESFSNCFLSVWQGWYQEVFLLDLVSDGILSPDTEPNKAVIRKGKTAIF